jgi:hypothetical protein
MAVSMSRWVPIMSYLIVANAETALGKSKCEGRQRARNEINEYQPIAL